MQEHFVLEELLALADRLNIEIRRAEGEFETGCCRLRGRAMLLLNPQLSVSQQIALLSRELGRWDLTQMFVLPAIRDRIEKH